MFKDIPRTFDTVIARDLWLWKHKDAPLLSSPDQDRLSLLPNDETKNPFGYEWANYGYIIAEMLEEQQRWSEAQAYWLASAHLLARDGKTSTEDFAQAITGIVRTGGSSTGMAAEEDTSDLQALLEAGASSLSVPTQGAIVRSLLIAGTVQSFIYEEVSSSQVRKLCAQELTKIAGSYLKHEPKNQKYKGSPEVFAEVAQAYTQDISQLQALTNGIAANPTLEYVKSQREKLMKILSRLDHIIFEYDRLVYSQVSILLGSKFTNYTKYMEEINEEAFNDFIQGVQTIMEESRAVGSHLAACIFAPLVLGIGAAINAHYQGNIASKIPDLKVQLLKPVACHADNVSTLEIEIVNDGTGTAYDCKLLLQPKEHLGIELDRTDMLFGTIEPNSPIIQHCKIHCSLDTFPFDLECTLEWRDRHGPHAQDDLPLKIIRQQAINWDYLESLGLPESGGEAPYTTRSISNPNKLKGRGEQIRTLRLGFQGKSSFMITGQKRVGKTSLVQVFLSQLKALPDVLPLDITIGNLKAASSDDLGQVGWELAKWVVDEYKVKFGVPASVAVPEVAEFRNAFNFTFTHFIREFLQTHPLRLVFALDDFDELSTQLFTGSTGKDFYVALRTLIDDGISFFFIGSERLPTIMSEQAGRLNQVRRDLKLDYLPHDAIVALAREPVGGWLEYLDDAIVEIETWSACNPYFATMICIALWERALNTRDRWITKRDVEYAVNDLATNSNDLGSYDHFWSDSPRAQEEQRSIYATKSIKIILALYKQQPNPLAYAKRQAVVRNCEGLDEEEANQHLKELINNGVVVETQRENNNFIRLRVPLFTRWLQEGGALELRRSEAAKEGLTIVAQQSDELSLEALLAVAEGLSYRKEKITTDQVRAWLAQFGPVRDQRPMLKLLKRLRDDGLFTEGDLELALKQLHEFARKEAAKQRVEFQMDAGKIANWYVTHINPRVESGSTMAKLLIKCNNIRASHFGDPEKVLSVMAKSHSYKAVLVCFDDFIRSGFSATNDLNTLILQLDNSIKDWRYRVLLIYATVLGLDEDIRYIEEHGDPDIVVLSLKHLTAFDKAFSKENNLFQTDDERIHAYDIANKIGKVLEKRHPLGFEDSQALIVFPDNVPNNTLPILWKDGMEYNRKPWKALFPSS